MHFLQDFLFDASSWFFSNNNILLTLSLIWYIINYFDKKTAFFYLMSLTFFSIMDFFLPYIFISFNGVSYKNIFYSNFLINLDFSYFFLYFGILFLSTTIISFICISFLGLYGVFLLNFISLFFFWLSLFYTFVSIFNTNIYFNINLFNWVFLTNSFKINFDLLIDFTSISFSFLTITIGLFVYLYAFSYFRYEPLVERLLLYLNNFMLSMVLLVSSGNLIVMYLGWELIGLSSFFLINFWSTRVGTLKAAFKAFSFNKLSDFFLLSLIFVIYNTTYSLDILSLCLEITFYENFFLKFFGFNFNMIEVLNIFLIMCAFIKSAQLGFHIWLPDSMEAPVPASALIHSATLVSAGIYLLLRFNNIVELSYYANNLITIFGSITAFYGGVVSAYQSDTKRTLAYSTISHCGFLMLLVSTGAVEFTVLYLYVHGFFKAATFLCIGNVNRFNRNIQDFRKMGGFFKYLPFECFSTLVCLLNLGGLPLTLGFFIKHLLFISYLEYNILYNILYSLVILGALSGIFYSYRLFYSIFFDIKKNKIYIYNQSLKNQYKSIFYTNTSLLSNISISFLIFFSYIIILYIYYKILNINYNISNININYNYNLFSYYYTPTTPFLLKLYILNTIIFILIYSCIYMQWRKTFFIEVIYYNYIYVITFILLIFLQLTFIF